MSLNSASRALQKAVVTGAGGTLGSVITARLAGGGYRVIAVDRDSDALAAYRRSHSATD